MITALAIVLVTFGIQFAQDGKHKCNVIILLIVAGAVHPHDFINSNFQIVIHCDAKYSIYIYITNVILKTQFIFSGNQVGYHVTLPCRNCMDSCNNGHFWMFHAVECKEVERMDDSGTRLFIFIFIIRL